MTEKGAWNIHCEAKGTVLSATTTAVIPFKTSEIKKNKKDTDVFPQQPFPASKKAVLSSQREPNLIILNKKKMQKKT